MLQEIVRQASALPASGARERHLEKLALRGTTVVVTGQQVGLFGGPLYTIHKAATAVARARWVEERTGRGCVPVFWLQTEDHDYAEIAEVTVHAPSGRVTLALPGDPEPSRVSLAHRVLPPEVEAALTRAEAALGSLPHAAELVALLRAHYVAGRPIADAFAGLVSELFRDEGLVVLNPRARPIACAAAPLFARVLDEHDAIASDLAARAEAIAAIGCDVQVPARREASLLFFHAGAIDGPRHRLIRREAGFETPEGPVAVSTLKELLEREPLRFSTSALLRPLVQDTVLPTCAYVGGPAELSYFAQLPPVYDRLGVALPLVAPRARRRVLDATTRSLLDRLGVSAAEAEHAGDALLARVAGSRDETATAATLEARLLGALHRELDVLSALGLKDLADPILKTREACGRSVNKLAGKVERALLERDQVAVDRVARVTLALRPGGVPQERAYGFLGLAARAGVSALVGAIVASARSFDPEVSDVAL